MKLILLVVFIFFSAFFSAVETAFISLSKIRLQHLVEKKQPGFQRVRDLRNDSQRLLITILIGNNLTNIAASAVATAVAIETFGSAALGIAVGGMTLILLIFGEITPKTIAMNKNEWIAVKSAPIIRFLQIVFMPMIYILEKISMVLSGPFKKKKRPIITEEEIKSVVNLGEEVGEVEEDEKVMIHNIFRFSDLEAYDIMVPRTRIFALDSWRPVKDCIPQIIEKGYSRIPVYEKKIDRVIGILYIKDLLKAIDKPKTRIKTLVRPVIFTPESMPVDDLLRRFQNEKIHMAMVVDEHGGISGLITIEDLLEEIVGDIYDESDDEKIMIKKLSKGIYIVNGATEIEEVNKAMNLDIDEKGDFETISGFILNKLKRFPVLGEEIELEKARLKVTRFDKHRILEVQIQK